MAPLPAEALADIKEYADRLESLHKSIKIEFDYLGAGDAKNIMPIKAPIYDKLNHIDIGIVLCYLRLSAKHVGKSTEFYFGKYTAPKGYHFMARVKIK